MSLYNIYKDNRYLHYKLSLKWSIVFKISRENQTLSAIYRNINNFHRTHMRYPDKQIIIRNMT